MILNRFVAAAVAIGILIVLFGVQGHADQSHGRFILPLACNYGKDCWAVNYVDVDATKNRQDYRCNAKTYDGHKATDFAVSSMEEIEKGVKVLAAADGTVLRMRDGERDFFKTTEEMNHIRKIRRECGNAIIINHKDGYKTMYCHLKQGSISVTEGQQVKAGDPIALMGLSGMTEFPHLDFGVLKNSIPYDPYTGAAMDEGCGQYYGSLWKDSQMITYEPVVIFDGGFEITPPNFTAIANGKKNTIESITNDAQALILWGGFYNVEEGDKIHFSILNPDTSVFMDTEIDVVKTQSRQFHYVGRKIRDSKMLTSGSYKGIVTITRKADEAKDGEATITRKSEFRVDVIGELTTSTNHN